MSGYITGADQNFILNINRQIKAPSKLEASS